MKINKIVFMNPIEIIYELPLLISSSFKWLYQIHFQYYALDHSQILKVQKDFKL